MVGCCLRVSSASNENCVEMDEVLAAVAWPCLCTDASKLYCRGISVAAEADVLPDTAVPPTCFTPLFLLYCHTQPSAGLYQWLNSSASALRCKLFQHMVNRLMPTPMPLPSDSLRQLPGTDFRRGSIKLPLTAFSDLTSPSSSSSFTSLHLAGRSHDFGPDFMG